ncbi:serine-rich adhesin for platelets-like isoform X2 [Palaemon carinicauda]|uniref:serine-rich adhesin for platelets-like isoform X2 n=1 Tax=Palaemon carinicauda TaxID=392227 RepID=UPI0035B5EFC2
MAAPRDDETNGQDPGGGGGGGGGLGGSGEGRSPREDTPPAPCAAFCGPRSCSTLPPSLSPQPPQQPQQQQAPVSTEPKRRRLWGLRGLVKMFRRRVRRRADESVSPQPPEPTLRARSTSELAVDIQHSRNSGPYNQGLSVSHDSVFSPDASADGHHGHTTPPALAIATRGVNMAELKAVLRRRRGDDSGSGDDDPGLPRSPPTSPTTLDVLNHGLKSCSRATQSTCSDGSLLSMGSSENDEDSLGIGSHHSSKVSLLEGRNQVVARRTLIPPRTSQRASYVSDTILDGRDPFSKLQDNEPVAGAVPLSHQAAHHKISVRPRRTHGAPRSRRSTQIAGPMSLPATPEVNEEANSKNATPPKPATAPVPPPIDAAVIQPVPLIDDQSKQEASITTESHEPEKKDEPLLQRIFGSVRSGRRRSRGSGDESRENSVSPMRRGGDQRTSREKRKDSTGSKFPMLGRTSTKSRQETHPLPPSGKARDASRERSKQEASSSPQTPRSASVEGRLESTTPGPPSIFRMSSYEERSSRPAEGVRKVKSFREIQGSHHDIHPKITPAQINCEDHEMLLKKASSVESLDGDTKTSSSRTISSSGVTDISASSHRSIDSLTNTSLPGVFIRPQSQSQYKVFKHKHQDQQLPGQQEALNGEDINSGPLSLDSSMTLQTREPEDLLRKASSVSHVGYTVDVYKANLAKDVDQSDSVSKRDMKSTSRSVSVEDKLDSRIKETKKYPGNAVQTDTDGTIKQKGSDEGEVDGESLRRRSLKKEPSMKRIITREPESSHVPEFMRIQLNKVENKGHSVIYDTDNDKQAKVESKGTESSYIPGDNELNVGTNMQKFTQEALNNMKIEPSHIIIESKMERPYLKKSNSKVGKSMERDISPSGSTLERKDHDSGVEGSSPEPTIERVILRKPLVSERAPVMERANSVAGQPIPSPTKNDQPELFKVFARRSFKIKDADKEKFQSFDYDEENIEASSEISEVTVVSTRPADNTASSFNTTTATAAISPLPPAVQGLQKSSINAISFNKKSVGNPTLAFCPPPAANVSNPLSSSPLSHKPIHIIPSNNTSGITSTNNVSTVPLSITTAAPSSSFNANQQGKSSVSPVQVSVIRPNTASSPDVAMPEANTVVPVQQGGITSKIISSRLSSMNVATNSDSTSGDEIENSSTPPSVTPTPKTSRSGSGLVWPPRSFQEEETQAPQYISQIRRLSSSPSSHDIEGNKTPVKSEENRDPVEISPLDIGAARRRFMSGSKDYATVTASATTSAQISPGVSTTTTVQSSSSSAVPISKTGPSVTEARNATPSFTITVRTQSVPSEHITTPDANTSIEQNTSTTSTPKSEQGTSPAADDWRVLVRQRREGRLKQTKTPDSEEIIIETRPPVSRNSKVLEMANNFQKLQVA